MTEKIGNNNKKGPTLSLDLVGLCDLISEVAIELKSRHDQGYADDYPIFQVRKDQCECEQRYRNPQDAGAYQSGD